MRAAKIGRNWEASRRIVVALGCAAGLAASSCVAFEDEDAQQTPDTTVPDTGVPEDVTGADTEELDGSDGPIEQEGNRFLSAYTAPPACEDGAVIAWPMEVTGCGYSFDPPTWQRASRQGVGGIIDPRQSCGTPAGATELRHPHLSFPTNDAQSTVAIQWMTDLANRQADVRIGTSPDALNTWARGWTFTYDQIRETRIVHEVHVCGLAPQTTYYYQVGGEGAWSEVYSFTTAPAYLDPDTEFTFAIAGDSRSPTQAVWGQALDAIEARGADLMLFSGDAVMFGSSQEQWDVWWEQASPTPTTNRLASMPLLYAHGNHDLVGDAMWAMLAQPGNEQSFYVRYGNTLFIVLDDSGTFITRETIPGQIRDLLEQALREHPDVTWRIAMNHKPLYSASNHGSQRDLQAAWGTLFEQYGVDLVINGHDHNYERTCPIRGGACVGAGEGPVYLVAAGVGAPLYDNGNDWFTVKSQKISTYAMATINGRSLTVTAYDLSGNVIDQFSLNKR